MAWQYQCRFVSDDGAPTTSRLLEEIVSNEMIRQPMRRGEFLGQLLASLLLNSCGVLGVCVCLWGGEDHRVEALRGSRVVPRTLGLPWSRLAGRRHGVPYR